MKSCALCGFRDATCETPWDGRQVPACATCTAPVTGVPDMPGHDSWADRVLSMARRFDSFVVRDLTDGLGYEDDDVRNRIAQAAHRLASIGALEVIGQVARKGNPSRYRYVRDRA